MPNHHEIQEHDPNHYPRGHDPSTDATLNVLYLSFPISLVISLVVRSFMSKSATSMLVTDIEDEMFW